MDLRKAFIGFLLLSLLACLPVKTVFSEVAGIDIESYNTCDNANLWTSEYYTISNSSSKIEGQSALYVERNSSLPQAGKLYPMNTLIPQADFNISNRINFTYNSEGASYLTFWMNFSYIYDIRAGWSSPGYPWVYWSFWEDSPNVYYVEGHVKDYLGNSYYGTMTAINLNDWYCFELGLNITAKSYSFKINNIDKGNGLTSGSLDMGANTPACIWVGANSVSGVFITDYWRLTYASEWPISVPPTLYEWFSNTGFESGFFFPWTIDNVYSFVTETDSHWGTHAAILFPAPEYLDMDFLARYSKSANTSKVRLISMWISSPSSDGENATFRFVYNDTSYYDVSVFTESIDWHLQDVTPYLNKSLSLTNFQIYDVQTGINALLQVDDIYFISTEAPQSGNSFDTQTLVSNTTLTIPLKIDGTYLTTPFILGDSGSHNVEAPKYWIINATHAYQFINWSDGSGSTERILSGAENYIVFYSIGSRDRQFFNEGWYNFGIGLVGVGLIFAGFVFMKIAWDSGEYDKALAYPLICWVCALGFITVLVGA